MKIGTESKAIANVLSDLIINPFDFTCLETQQWSFGSMQLTEVECNASFQKFAKRRHSQ